MPLWELNPAESMFAPFREELVAPQLPLTCTGVEAAGFLWEFSWDSVKLQWETCAAGAVACTIELAMGALPARFDQYVFSMVVPAGVGLLFEAQRDGAWQALGEPAVGRGDRIEVSRPIGAPAAALRATLTSAAPGPVLIYLRWWGVADSTLLAGLASARPQYDAAWPGLIRPEAEWTEVKFARGLLFAEGDLENLRAKAEHPGWKGHFAMLEERARKTLSRNPEAEIGDFLPWSDYRYLRERERGHEPWTVDPVLCALVGLVRRDRELIRHALRYLMCFVHTTHWTQSAESRARGSTWDQRCFIEEMTTTTCALVYDWLWFALTDRARDLVRVAIWDKGLSIIQRDMVKWEYLYTMNQGPWFCRARIFGGLVMEPTWPRTRPYVEQAYTDLQEGMAHYLLPDGGVDEGVGYFSVTLQAVLPGLMAYARARGKPIQDVLPPRLAKSGAFVAVMSAMEPGRVLLDGDNTNDRFTGDTMALLAAFYPDDVYARVAASTLLDTRGDSYYRQYMVDGPFAFIAGPMELPKPECVVPEFGHLPHAGAITSRRTVIPGREVRLHVTGCKAHASHTHFDKGAFTLELGRTPVLIDRGMIRYDDVRSSLFKRTEYHNVLTPMREDGTAINQLSPEEGVIPSGSGDSRQFHARIDLTHVCRPVMQRYVREVNSESPERFAVHDHGELAEAHALSFHLHTRGTWQIDAAAKRAELVVAGWKLTLDAPWADELVQAEDFLDHLQQPVWHLQARTGRRSVFDFETVFTCTPL